MIVLQLTMNLNRQDCQWKRIFLLAESNPQRMQKAKKNQKGLDLSIPVFKLTKSLYSKLAGYLLIQVVKAKNQTKTEETVVTEANA
jgi:hypothetical protein